MQLDLKYDVISTDSYSYFSSTSVDKMSPKCNLLYSIEWNAETGSWKKRSYKK